MSTGDAEALTLQVTAVTDTNFGDHGAMMRVAHVAVPGETVEDLVRRCFPRLGQRFATHNPADWIEIRVAVDVALVAPAPEPDPWASTPVDERPF